jgi:hypothetical protein
LAATFLATPALCIELQIQHAVIQKILADTIFTDEGRKYLQANRAAKCTYAYLENPQISAEQNRVKIRARFSGRTARDFFGRCIGLGDSFVVVIRATPYYHDGLIGFKDVAVDSDGKDGLYIRRVRAAMAASLSTEFAYDVLSDAKKILEESRKGAPYRQELSRFTVTGIRVNDQAIIVSVDFTLAIKLVQPK